MVGGRITAGRAERDLNEAERPRLQTSMRATFFCGTLCSIAGWRCTQYDGIVAWAVCERLGRGCGGWFDDVCHVGRRDRPCFGGPAGDRLWNSDQGIQYRQHPDCHRRDGCLHRRDHVRALGRRQGTEEHRAQARPGRAADARRCRIEAAQCRKRFPVRPGSAGSRRRRAAPLRPSPPPPWQDEAVLRDHPIPGPMFPEDTVPPPPPAPKPKRNLLFSSTSRKERERAQARTSEPLPLDCCRRIFAPTRRRPNRPSRNPRRSTMHGPDRTARGPAKSRRRGAARGRP